MVYVYLLAKKGIQIIIHTFNSNTYHTTIDYISFFTNSIFNFQDIWMWLVSSFHPLPPTRRLTLTQSIGSIGYNIISPHPNCTQQPYRITVTWMSYATGVSTVTLISIQQCDPVVLGKRPILIYSISTRAMKQIFYIYKTI